jgi:hypothetical protein
MKIKSLSAQTQLNSIYYTELHVSTYLRSSSCSQLVLKHTEEEIYIMYVGKTQLQLLKLFLFMTSTCLIILITVIEFYVHFFLNMFGRPTVNMRMI